MIKHWRLSRIFVPIFAAVCGILFLLGGLSGLALAAPGDLFVTVGGSGSDCSQSAPCGLQEALSQAIDGDAVYLAQGTYTGAGPSVITVTNSITLYGGWDGTMTVPPVRDPKINPTTLDGEGLRRVVFITGTITPTLEGLRLTNGSNSSRGGGIVVYGAHPVISGCWIFGNTGKDGGGVSLNGSANAMLVGNEIYSNTADQYGGGVASDTSLSITLMGNKFYSNTAHEDGGAISLWSGDNAKVLDNDIYSNVSDRDGGGIYIREGHTVLTDNVISHNTATDEGGGVYLRDGGITLVDNQVLSNTSADGGGIYLYTSPHTVLISNTIHANVALTGTGGGIYLYDSDNPWLVDNTVYSNTANYSGGGIRFNNALTATLTGNHVYDNAASDGGGIHLHNTYGATLTDNMIYGNKLTSYKYGGGVYLSDSGAITLTNNWIYSNTARYGGGGLCLQYALTVTMVGNHIVSNTTNNDYGGGVYAMSSSATLAHNVVHHNTAFGYGGGLAFWDSEAALDGNQVVGNIAGSEAGISFGRSTATLVNNVVADNLKMGFPCASGIGIEDSTITLTHNTIARNRGLIPGSGIYVAAPSAQPSVVTLINNILVSHTVGITVAAGNTATMEATLWGDGTWANETAWDGSGTIFTGTIHIWESPDFMDPDGGDYHIAPSSAAVDQAIDTEVAIDIDGDRRPIGAQPDIGADEAWKRVFLPLTLRDYS